MHKILHNILFLHCLQNIQKFHTIASLLYPDETDGYNEEDSPEDLMLQSGTESAHWPLKAGYPGLQIKNLNEYVSFFSHCLVNIQNYQGIEIIGIQSPVYITRFDVAVLEVCDNSTVIIKDYGPDYETRRFFFGRISPRPKRNCSINYEQSIKYADKSIKARWYCAAQFDLFFPEPKDAPHIVHHSQGSEVPNPDEPYQPWNLFDVASIVPYMKTKGRAGVRYFK